MKLRILLVWNCEIVLCTVVIKNWILIFGKHPMPISVGISKVGLPGPGPRSVVRSRWEVERLAVGEVSGYGLSLSREAWWAVRVFVSPLSLITSEFKALILSSWAERSVAMSAAAADLCSSASLSMLDNLRDSSSFAAFLLLLLA